MQHICVDLKHELLSTIAMGKENLDVAAILERLDKQQKLLNMSRQDICALTGIPYSTFTGAIQKKKLPRFNDLYLISLAIGLPIDLLLRAPIEYSTDLRNICAWINYMPEGDIRRFLVRFPDKVAIAKMFKALSDELEGFFLFLPPTSVIKNKDDLKAGSLFNLLAMDEFYSFFCYSHMVDAINGFYGVKQEETLCITDYYNSGKQLAATLWGYPNIAVEYLWTHVEELIPTKYPNTSAFLKEAGINSVTHARYLCASQEEASPGVETVVKVCSLLGIDDIDGAIRSKLPEIVEKSDNSYQKLGIIPHQIENKAVKDNLKSLPYLAMFADMLFSLSYPVIEKIYSEVYKAAITHPKSSESLRKLPFVQDPPSQENPYILPSPLKNADLIKDYGDDLHL